MRKRNEGLRRCRGVLWLALLAWVLRGGTAWSDPGDLLSGQHSWWGHDQRPGTTSSKPGDLLWEDVYDSGRSDSAPVVAARQGRVVVAGTTRNASGNTDILVRAYDGATGDLLWQDQFDHAGSWDHPLAVVIGNHMAIVTGGNVEFAPGTNGGVIRAYDLSNGTLIWQELLDTGGVGRFDAVVLHGNKVIATGYGGASCTDFNLGGAIGCDLMTRAYDARTGALLWEDRFDGLGGFDEGNGIAATGNVIIVVGQVWPVSDDAAAWLVRALDSRTGEVLWQDQGTPVPFTFGNSLAAQAVTAGGNVFVVGEGENSDWLIRAYHARTGTLPWEQTYHLADAGLPEAVDLALQVATDGRRLFVGGYGSHPGPDFSRDWVVNAYDTWTGKLLWSDVLDLAGGFDEVAGGIAFQSGQVFAYGFVVSERGDLDVLLRAYDARTGALLWQDQVDKAQRTEFFASFWFKSLAADRGRVTIAASSAILHPDDRIDSDWIVRTYDASHPHKDHHHHHGYDGHDEDHDGKEDGDDRD